MHLAYVRCQPIGLNRFSVTTATALVDHPIAAANHHVIVAPVTLLHVVQRQHGTVRRSQSGFILPPLVAQRRARRPDLQNRRLAKPHRLALGLTQSPGPPRSGSPSHW